jgi:thymidylate synthase
MYFKVESVSDLYFQVGNQLLGKGEKVAPRGTETKELRSVNIELTNPANNLMLVEDRKFNLAFALAESIMLFDSSDDSNFVKYYSYFNDTIKNYSDDGVTMEGAYSSRVAANIPRIISMLKEDPNTRQAVLQIYGREFLDKTTKDVPCTLNLQFLLRDNKLELHVYMRSNDIIWGLPYDIFNFTNLQMVVANTIGADLGSYFHTVSSMHVYERHYELLLDIVSDLSLELVHNKTQACKFPISTIQYHNINNYTQQLALVCYYCNTIVNQYSMTLAINKLDGIGAAQLGDEQIILLLEQNLKYRKTHTIEKIFELASSHIKDINLLDMVKDKWGVKL